MPSVERADGGKRGRHIGTPHSTHAHRASRIPFGSTRLHTCIFQYTVECTHQYEPYVGRTVDSIYIPVHLRRQISAPPVPHVPEPPWTARALEGRGLPPWWRAARDRDPA